MKQFLETIRITDGIPQHLSWHQSRVNATLSHFFPDHPHTWHLEKCIVVPENHSEGEVKCRIIYDAHHFEIHFYPFERNKIETLKVVEASPDMDYRYKYADRTAIDKLYDTRGTSHDILISKNGWITDTSIANIALSIDDRWYTPSIPLLAGTTWKRLVESKILMPKPINLKEIVKFDCFKIFNALHDFDEMTAYPVGNIH